MRRARGVEIIEASNDELKSLLDLQIRYHFRFPAVFSCNRRGEIWLFRTYGYTRPEDRVDVRHILLLRKIARVVLRRRRIGGRFFVTANNEVYTVLDDDQTYTLIAAIQTSSAGATRTRPSSRRCPTTPEPAPSPPGYDSVAAWCRRMRKQFGDLWDSD